MQVIITKSFKKQLLKLGSIHIENLLDLLKKYPHTRNLVLLDTSNTGIILKGYLLSKKVRVLILLKQTKNTFVPVSLVRKESQKGYNITKENYQKIFLQDIAKVIEQIDKNDFERIEIET
ncbi:hypothetical protein KGV52_01890 [Candidatus Gracilibacteria bacterium]|nr:hypothetical protein [Candidatus Gracilibacteria bacterium]